MQDVHPMYLSGPLANLWGQGILKGAAQKTGQGLLKTGQAIGKGLKQTGAFTKETWANLDPATQQTLIAQGFQFVRDRNAPGGGFYAPQDAYGPPPTSAFPIVPAIVIGGVLIAAFLILK
mgnify:FL=1|tara:strand:+ start:753 stop:1112 length:360 start_codon:yes stop_codon:yes gene_type:complete